MQIQGTTLSGYKVYEYLLVLSPHRELWDKIMEVKKKFADDYQSEHARWGKPHVMLVNFVQYAMMEERLVNRLRIVAMGHTPFFVKLKDFGSLPTHSIFINVISKLPVQGLIKEIRKEAQRLMKLNSDNKPYFLIEPQITIGRKLEPWQYEKGWAEYSQKEFTGKFIADSMVLLKRPVGEMKYDFVQKFEFQHMPVLVKQGELFQIKKL